MVLLKSFVLIFKKCCCCVVSKIESHLRNFPAGFLPSISLSLLPVDLPNSKGSTTEADLDLPQLSKDSLLSPLHNAATINFAGISIFEAA